MKTYEVYSRETGELLVEGTITECASAIGLSRSGFNHAVNAKHHSRFCFVDTTEEDEVTDRSTDVREAIKAWDAFCEPLRKKYGIPVYRPRKEKKENG